MPESITEHRVRPVEIPVGEVVLEADLTLPPGTDAVVVFAHGTGSGRHSPRNRLVASTLSEAGLGTLLMDLLTPDEGERDLATLEIVPGATHLFEESGALERVAALARDWFVGTFAMDAVRDADGAGE